MPPPAALPALADAVIAAFRKHRIVAIGEIHGRQEHYDAIQTLLFDPRLPAMVDDIDTFPGECGEKFGELFDALLYLGQVEVVIRSLTNPAIFLDPEYWAELRRRFRSTGTGSTGR